jgi:hypothetical protein
VANRIEKHPELPAGFAGGLRCSDRERVLFRGVEVLDLKVDMKLLRDGTIRPRRRHVLLNLLEVDGGMVAVHQIGTSDVIRRHIVLGLDF